MKAKWLPISAAVALALGSFSASAVDFHGYMRAGVQNNLTNGGAVRCFGTGGADGHLVGRLGDECDTYAEIALTQEVFNKAKNKFTVNTLVMWGSQEGTWDHQGNSFQSVNGGSGYAWNGQRASFREGWAGYTLPSGIQIWAGKRYYQRKDIHILDFYYLNNSGNGAGVEGIPVGNLGQASIAVIKGQTDGNDDYARDIYKIDTRWNGIPLWKDASLDLAMIWGLPSTTDSLKDAAAKEAEKKNVGTSETSLSSNSGVLLMAEYTQGNFFGGFNKLSVTYGTRGFAGVGALGNHAGDTYAPGDADSWGIRVIDWGLVEQDKWNLGYSFMGGYKHTDDSSKGAHWSHPSGHDYSFVIRPAYKWSNFTSTVFEAGYYVAKNNWAATFNNGDGEYAPGKHNPDDSHVDAYKFTLAQQFSPMTTFWARPSIRFYVSYLGGDRMDKSQTGFDDHDGEVSIGAQAEAWW